MMTQLVCEVLVIGAGLAGLAAGHDLASRGCNVKIVESLDRVGGRVWTRHFADGTHCEEGPFSFGNGEQPLWDYVQQFNLPVVQLTPMKRKFYFKDYAGNTDEKRSFFQGKERKVVLAELFDYFRPALEKIVEDIPFMQALEHIEASPEAIEWLQSMTLPGLLGNDFQKLSTKAVLAFMKQYDSSTAFYGLQGGNDQLPQAFAQKLEGHILFNHEIHTVEQREETCLAKGRTFSIEAKRIIFATPLPALHKIAIHPPLSLEKREAIATVSYVPCARLSIVAPPHVVRAIPRAGVFIFSDRVGWIRDQSAFQKDVNKKTVINASVVADKAENLPSIEEWKAHLNGLLSQTYDCWDAQKTECYGNVLKEGYSSFSVNGYRQRKHLSEPEGKLYFAGEHTSKNFASMNGAIQSGKKAAVKILASLASEKHS